MPTKSQIKQLERAMSSKGASSRIPAGIIEYHGTTRGLAHSSWDRMMKRMCEDGLFRPYVHGGYEITEAGRAAAPKVETPPA